MRIRIRRGKLIACIIMGIINGILGYHAMLEYNMDTGLTIFFIFMLILTSWIAAICPESMK